MPELAEVEFFRRQWNPGLGQRIVAVETHSRARVFRGAAATALPRALRGERLLSSAAAAKHLLFRFSGEVWLGLHLGMSGELAARPAGHPTGKHDHLVLRTAEHALVFTDPRMFGRVDLHRGAEPPPWWTALAPPLLSPQFTVAALTEFLRRRARAPLKAVLLMQERFPGVGNWMADEILWRAALHPRRRAGSLAPAEIRTLRRECRRVARLALDTIAGRTEADTPPSLNIRIPDTWLFNHRWRDGGRCPRTGCPLVREEIGGRTTCWSPLRQPEPRAQRR
ncbi:MAG TPA: DNA-formamidopyrimidine glycosylase family protein [Opitutaceae bacterium]|nr:DNA-formamidopyrimidine glycosylase family protein [Opitutaceae bacterium]